LRTQQNKAYKKNGDNIPSLILAECKSVSSLVNDAFEKSIGGAFEQPRME
jgi:hypothetical protein